MSLVDETRAPIFASLDIGPAKAAITRLLGEAPVRVWLERTHFPGKRPIQMVLAAELRSGGVATVLAEHCPADAATHAAEVIASLGKSRNGQRPALRQYPVLMDPDTGLVLRRPGLDERLPGLRMLHDAAFARETVLGVTGTDPGPVRVRLMAHRLGKRAVLRIDGRHGRCFARLRAIKSDEGPTRYARHRMLWEALGGTGALRVPEPLGENAQIGLSLFAPLPGMPPDFGDPEMAEGLARALSCLRALEIDGLPAHSGADEARLLEEWLDRCRRYQPAVALRLHVPVAEVADRLSARASDLCPAHRDLHEKQILVSPRGFGLLDFDTLSLADPALDPGNLSAHVFLAGGDDAGLRRRFETPGLPLWRRAALLRLAMIHAFTSIGAGALDRLIKEACRDDRD